MNLLCKMFKGDYVLKENKVGHEFINLIKADDGYFYIWLNANGTFASNKAKDNITVLMVRTINFGIYKVLAKAINCSLVDGADSSKTQTKEERYNLQKDISYKGVKLSKIHVNKKLKTNEIEVLVTFKTSEVYKAKKDIYVTNNKKLIDGKSFFELNISGKSTMRQNFTNNKNFNVIINESSIWEVETSKDTIYDFINEYKDKFPKKDTMFSILKKEKDENIISNAFCYFLEKYNYIGMFLNSLDSSIDKEQKFELKREKDKVDLLFIGDKDIVVIENKVNSEINGIDRKADYSSQIDKIINSDYIKKILKENKKSAIQIKNELLKLKSKGPISQLSKYFIIAYIIAEANNIRKDHVHYYLLTPNYSKCFYKVDANDYIIKCLGEELFLCNKYKMITYSDVYEIFAKIRIKKKYFSDFKKTIKTLTYDTYSIYETKIADTLKRIYKYHRY